MKNRVKALLKTRIAAGAIGALVGLGLGLAATGSLPNAMQNVIADAFDNVGLNLPGGADDPAAQPAPAPAGDEEGTAFGVRGDGDGGETGRVRRRFRYYEPADCNDYCRQYLGLDEEEEEEALVEFEPPEPPDRPHQNPGTGGEPGEPGIPDEDNDTGDADGVHGPDGPAGDPG